MKRNDRYLDTAATFDRQQIATRFEQPRRAQNDNSIGRLCVPSISRGHAVAEQQVTVVAETKPHEEFIARLDAVVNGNLSQLSITRQTPRTVLIVRCILFPALSFIFCVLFYLYLCVSPVWATPPEIN